MSTTESRQEALRRLQASHATGASDRVPDEPVVDGSDAGVLEPADPADLLARVAHDATLLAAWSTVRESDADDGALSRDSRDFERAALDHLAELKHELEVGTWQPGPVTRFAAREDPGRVFTVARVRDRVVERALSEVIGPVIDPTLSPFSFAYRRGLGVRDAVAALREALLSGWTHVARADVRSAFDEVPRTAALAALAARVSDRRVVDLVGRLLARLDEDGLAGIGIPQGSAVSPLLLNVYLDPVDRALIAEGLLCVRYADDIAVPVESERRGLAVIDHLAEELASLGLALNEDKCAVVAADNGVDFLGSRVGPVGAPGDDSDHVHPRRINLFVTGHGALARLRGHHVRVDRDGETVASVALPRVRTLVLGERVGITRPLLDEACSSGTDIVLVSEHGGYVGRLSRRRGSDLRTRRAQFRRADDEGESVRLAAQFVSGKLANMRVGVLRELRRRGEPHRSHARAGVAGTLERASGHAVEAISLPALMGVEGAAARAYFEWVGDGLGEVWGFRGRNRRPPRDPVNAMLSFGYTLLSAEMVSACEIAGLDPDLGFLHSPRWGRPSLALDLVEEWRPVLVDTVVLGLARGRVVTPDDFAMDPERGCRMSDKARRAFLAAYERRLLTPVTSPVSKGRAAYRELLGLHARSLAAHLVDPTIPYQGYRWR